MVSFSEQSMSDANCIKIKRLETTVEIFAAICIQLANNTKNTWKNDCLISSLPKKGVRSCVYELYWLVTMRKCPYWLQ